VSVQTNQGPTADSIDRNWYGTANFDIKKFGAMLSSFIQSISVSARYSKIRGDFILEEGTAVKIILSAVLGYLGSFNNRAVSARASVLCCCVELPT